MAAAYAMSHEKNGSLLAHWNHIKTNFAKMVHQDFGQFVSEQLIVKLWNEAQVNLALFLFRSKDSLLSRTVQSSCNWHFPVEVARRHSQPNSAPVTAVHSYWLASCFAVCWPVTFLLWWPFQCSHVMAQGWKKKNKKRWNTSLPHTI